MNKTQIKNWNPDDRPREKLRAKGPLQMTDSELLAILIQNGTKNLSAMELAKQLLERCSHRRRRWRRHRRAHPHRPGRGVVLQQASMPPAHPRVRVRRRQGRGAPGCGARHGHARPAAGGGERVSRPALLVVSFERSLRVWAVAWRGRSGTLDRSR